MSMTYTRAELGAILESRRRSHSEVEGQGDQAWLDFRIRVTPELVHEMLGGRWVYENGSEAVFNGVYVGDDGYAEPIFVKREVPA